MTMDIYCLVFVKVFGPKNILFKMNFSSCFLAHTAMKVYVPMLQMRQVINGSRASKSKARDLKGKRNHQLFLA